MAFQVGYNGKIYIAGYDLTTFFKSMDIEGDTALHPKPAFGSGFMDRIPGLKDAACTLQGYQSNAAGDAGAVLDAAIGSGGNIWALYPNGESSGSTGYGFSMTHDTLQRKTPVDGIAELSVSGESSTGFDFLKSLDTAQTETGTGTGSILDNTAQKTGGGAIFLQVTAFTGTDCTIKVHDSNDNFSADDNELASFASVTGIGAQRVAYTGTAERYLRWEITGGTFSSITFQVGVSIK